MKKSVKNLIITFVIGCTVYVVGKMLTGGFIYNNVNEFLIDFGFYQLYAFVLGYSNMYFFWRMNRVNWKRNSTLKRIIVGVVGSTTITLVGLFFLRALTSMYYAGNTFEAFLAREKFEYYQFGLWITLIIVAIFHLIYFYNKYQQNKLKEQKVIAGTASAKFDALKNQLDPHFLFNSLNVLTSLIEENPNQAQKFTTSLSKVYRYVLEQKSKELVTVDEELQFAKTYMSLLKMRFEDSIVFTMPEQAANPESKVVPLSLQLLLENAVKHNMVTSSKPLRIKIYEDKGYLVVENNLQPKQIVKKSSGVGLSNIMQRYKLLTSKKVDVNKQANSFAVAIPMLTKQISVMRPQTSNQIDDSYLRARNHVEELKNFYYSLLSYCLVIPFLIFINYRTYWGFQWFWFPMFGWGLGLIIQAFRVFYSNKAFGGSWEKRKIEQFMREEENRKWN
ncbi:histidine kinase [Jejuia pallidilutea]|uniref:Putative two-component system sensor protein histidine kinase n=1 Tax=Jejuia pallidilutea TaxID=504487 RepID=A0A090WMD5_9FLAO|nr:histidine kinase [Jejuia pallidilutea]GAL68607.1 putative two-component system sensor protein histidine kinase [Jejuia pallidilutea]GAL90193.1 putative two-component system sensor protein histidine kinase [Jejuia pallidilutea]